jgi:hypothetical protein
MKSSGFTYVIPPMFCTMIAFIGKILHNLQV